MSSSDSSIDDPTRAVTGKQALAGATATDDSGSRRQALELLGVGDTIDRYQIREVLGAGGMGVVYRAHDPDLDRAVAIKLLRNPGAGSSGGDPASEQRLLREARAMAKLVHPNLVTVFDVGASEGRVFVAMEYVEGRTLKQWIGERRRSFRERFEALMGAGRGIAKAHSVGVVHRDLKPDNILVRDDDTAMVADFGLARSAGEGEIAVEAGIARADPLAVQLTSTGALLGTPAYMSPEQFLGKPVDARCDQFSFAVVVYWALYGHRPFPGETIEELAGAVLLGKIAPPPATHDVPKKILPVLERALRTNPDQRYATMEELLAALERAATGSRRQLVLLGAGVAMLAMTLAAFLVLGSQRQRAAPTTPPPITATPAANPDTADLIRLLSVAGAAADSVGELLGDDVKKLVQERIAKEIRDHLAEQDRAATEQARATAEQARATAEQAHAAEEERRVVIERHDHLDPERLDQVPVLPRLEDPTADYHDFGELLLLKMMSRHRDQVDGCLRAANSRGTVVSVAIDRDGHIVGASAAVPGAAASEVAACLARVGADWSLPRPASGREVQATVPVKRTTE